MVLFFSPTRKIVFWRPEKDDQVARIGGRRGLANSSNARKKTRFSLWGLPLHGIARPSESRTIVQCLFHTHITICLSCFELRKKSFEISKIFQKMLTHQRRVGCSTAVLQGDHMQLSFFTSFWRGLKNNKIIYTQSFLSTSYIDILIFWGLTMVRWKKSCLSGLC